MNGLKWGVFVLAILGVGFFAGPKYPKTNLVASNQLLPAPFESLDKTIKKNESALPVRPGNEARIVWANDSLKNKTEYAIVYLHGFSASHVEGNPIHTKFAQRYGANLYLSRLSEHGIEKDEPLLEMTPYSLIESAEEALEIGSSLGGKVILMSGSTGGTLSLWLASQYPDQVHSLIMFSPNIDLFDPNADWLIRPWGKQIARRMLGSDYREWSAPDGAEKYWYTKYRIESILALKSMIEATMTEKTFETVNQPVLMIYYYKNEDEQDKVVSVPAMLDMFLNLSTPATQKRAIALDDAHHILCSPYFYDKTDEVFKYCTDFAETVLELDPAVIEQVN